MSNVHGLDLAGHANVAERRVIRVRAPQANAGVGDALRRAFAPPARNGVDQEFARLLERI